MAQESAAEQQVDTEDYIIKVQGVWKTYRMGDQEVHALHGVYLDVIRGEICQLWGLRGQAKPRCLTWLER
jgi:putative ABC transport system ATP-binding protein